MKKYRVKYSYKEDDKIHRRSFLRWNDSPPTLEDEEKDLNLWIVPRTRLVRNFSVDEVVDDVPYRVKWIASRAHMMQRMELLPKIHRQYHHLCKACLQTLDDTSERYLYEGVVGNRIIYWCVCERCHETIKNYDLPKVMDTYLADFRESVRKFKERIGHVNS